MSERQPLNACRAARVGIDGLAALAPYRQKRGVRIVLGEFAWVEWDEERPDIVAALFAVPGVEFFERRGNQWFRPGHQLPIAETASPGDGIPIDRAILPAAFEPVLPDSRETRRVPLTLVRSDIPRSTSAMRCRIDSLRAWSDSATTSDISVVQAARCGMTAWLKGERLPAILDAERFWGERVWRPIGWRTEPDWPEAALREAAGVGPDEILVLTNDRAEAIPADAFRPLSRAAIRLAVA